MVNSRRAYAYAGILILGVLFITPVAGILLSKFGIPATIALIAVLGAVAGVYASVVLTLGDTEAGLLIAVLVLMTVGANVPFGSPVNGLHVNPELFLVDFPLLIFVAITLKSWRDEHLTIAHLFLVCYVIWTILLIAIAPGPRTDVMGYYALHTARIVLVFGVVSRGIVDGLLRARTALGIFVATTIGHSIVASTQPLTGPIPALTVLGMNDNIVAQLSLGPLGTIPTGPYVGGFTGGAPITVHLMIVLPIAAAAVFYKRIPKIAVIVGVAWLFFVVQLTAWDAARGASLVGFATLFLLLGWWITDVLWDRTQLLSTAGTRSWVVRRWRLLTLSGVGVAGVLQLAQFGASPRQPRYVNAGWGQAFANTVSIPGFDTDNLAVRVAQYVGGFDTFLKYPLTGLGGANYNFIALDYGEKQHMIHNLVIGVFAETGLVGGILYFGAMIYCLRAGWVMARRDDDPILIAVLSGLVGVVALQMFQPQYLKMTSFVPVWAVLGVLCGYYQTSAAPAADSSVTHILDNSRLATALRSARTTQSVAELPDSLHAAIAQSVFLWPVRDIINRQAAISDNSRLVQSVHVAWSNSQMRRLWEMMKTSSRNSRLF